MPRIFNACSEHASSQDVALAIAEMEDAAIDRFVILERSGQHYMQCLCTDAGWILEKREGDEDRHFRATIAVTDTIRRAIDEGSIVDKILATKPNGPRRYLHTFEVVEAMRNYLVGARDPERLAWERTIV